MLISFEGLPGAGKTTQSRRLADRLTSDGRSVAYLPDLATLAADALGDSLFALFASSGDAFRRHGDVLTDTFLAGAVRAYITDALIAPAAATHDVVIEDRGVHTMYAYSLATVLRDRPATEVPDAVRCLSAIGELAGRRADVALYLQVPLHTALHRSALREGVPYTGEQAAYLGCVAEAYEHLATVDDRMVRLDVGRSDVDAVAERVHRELAGRCR